MCNYNIESKRVPEKKDHASASPRFAEGIYLDNVAIS